MTELDQVWSEMLGSSHSRAIEAGDHDLARYLRLKATNDAIRARGVAWLLDTLIGLAAEEQRIRHGIVIEREEPYSFPRGNSKMVGSAIIVRQGVRCLTVGAGWARTPSDGIMQKGALSYGRIHHFGMPRFDIELRLDFIDDLPMWKDESGNVVDTDYLQHHLDILLG
jgi:hypothetical protein